jgi:hypothetical protein
MWFGLVELSRIDFRHPINSSLRLRVGIITEII